MSTMPEIILASESPRRIEILSQLLLPVGLSFRSVCPAFEEVTAGFPPEIIATMNAKGKVDDIAKESTSPAIIIGADTVINLDNMAVGKPKDKADAQNILESLSGRTHSVVSGVALLDTRSGEQLIAAQETTIVFRNITATEIDWYIDSKEPYDKAGAYGIQGLGELFVEKIEGSFSNVMGLPKKLVVDLLAKTGLPEFAVFRLRE